MMRSAIKVSVAAIAPTAAAVAQAAPPMVIYDSNGMPWYLPRATTPAEAVEWQSRIEQSTGQPANVPVLTVAPPVATAGGTGTAMLRAPAVGAQPLPHLRPCCSFARIR